MAESCAAITKSKIHANLDQDAMFKELWFLEYCCCGGRGIGDVGNPFFGSEVRELCMHSTCEMTEVGNPFCSGLTVNCCITQQCAFPKLDGSPTCVCFNKQLAGGGTESWKPNLFDFSPGFKDQFWIQYFLCGGCAVHGIGGNGRPILGSMQKELCVKQAMRCVAPIQDGILCSGLGTCLCFWDQMQFPPAANNPKIACCGWKMNKYGTSKGPLGYGKPGQIEMN